MRFFFLESADKNRAKKYPFPDGYLIVCLVWIHRHLKITIWFLVWLALKLYTTNYVISHNGQNTFFVLIRSTILNFGRFSKSFLSTLLPNFMSSISRLNHITLLLYDVLPFLCTKFLKLVNQISYQKIICNEKLVFVQLQNCPQSLIFKVISTKILCFVVLLQESICPVY